MYRLFLTTLLLLSLGCALEKAQPAGGGDGSGGGGGGGDDSGDGGGGGGDDSGGGAEALPDLVASLEAEACEGAGGYEDVPGATSFFVGTFELADGVWEGEEIWLLYANPAWEAEGGADCRVVWAFSGAEISPESCASCELGVSISATLDSTLTDCPEDLYAGSETYNVDYDVDLSDDRATVYFSSSGNLLGRGYSSGDAFNYATEPTCLWF